LHLQQKKPLAVRTRTCDGCDLCCTVSGVAALEKPPGIRCRHLTVLAEPGRNCMIYERRPADCKSFLCIWRSSDTALSEAFRPADCGFALWVNDPFQWPMVITVGVDPARPDAWDQPHYRARFAEIAWELNCMVAIGQGALASHVFAPSGTVYAKGDYPMFFLANGHVGVPDFDFRPGVRPSIREIASMLMGIPA